MRYRITALAATLLLGGISAAAARTYYLPDYQSEFYSGSRSQTDNSGHHTSTPSCGDYGFYSAPQNNAECTRVNPPAPGLTCYSCTACSSDFTYDSSNCSGDYVTSGSSCGGRYNQCTCDPSKFQVSSSGGCPSGQKTDLSASCKAPSDTDTYYKCIEDLCYGIILKNACETQGDYCVPSDQCPAGCEQCIDRCQGYKSYEGAIECDNGCMNASDQISGCSGLCKAGSTCKPITCDEGYELSGDTCVPKACSGYLDTCPAHALCNDTCQSGETVKYKPTGCSSGYYSPSTYWCSDKPFC